jgi:hypothetical protein
MPNYDQRREMEQHEELGKRILCGSTFPTPPALGSARPMKITTACSDSSSPKERIDRNTPGSILTKVAEEMNN